MPNIKKDFVHLHGHTTYSLGDATTRVEDLAKKVAELGMKSCAITDHGTMAGIVEFWKECKSNDVKPIFGIEAYIAMNSAKEKLSLENSTGHLILLAKNKKGYSNLCKLLREATKEENFNYHPRIDLDILSQYSEGLIGLTSCVGGLPQKLALGWSFYDKKAKERFHKEKDEKAAVEMIGKMRSIFEKDSFFLEVQNHSISTNESFKLNPDQQDDYIWLRDSQAAVAKFFFWASKHLDVPVVITNDFHYLSSDMSDTRQAILAIGGRGYMDERFSGDLLDKKASESLEDKDGVHEVTRQMYLKSPEEMYEMCKQYPELIKNTLFIDSMIEDVDLSPPRNDKGQVIWNIPVVDTQDLTPYEFLEKKVREGFDKRYPGDGIAPWRTKEVREEALKRVDYELSVMRKLGLESYHLMVADYVNWASDNGILVGPGRGSGAGSIVVYCLGITDVDPLRHGLLFERYLNPDRASAADLDVDFDPDKVDQIYNYCINKYGSENVAKISAYQSIHAKGSVRKLGRAMCLDSFVVEDISSKLPKDQGEFRTTLKEIVDDSNSSAGRAIQKFLHSDPMCTRFIDIACRLDDVKISRGQHAAGIVISKDPLGDFVPLVFHDRSDETSIATEFPFEHLEDIGLLKQDLLVVDGLTIIRRALAFIRESNPDFSLPLEVDETYQDEATYAAFANGDLGAVWQMSSSGMRELCTVLQPKTLYEIAAICALFRPGPLDFVDPDTGFNMVETYIRRKQGLLPIAYDCPEMENILRETYGVIVFQEQIMQIGRELCGWTYTEADYLRKAVAKKKPEQIAEQKKKFIPSLLKNLPHVEEAVANRIWDQIETFGRYGFNKSHTVAYGKLSYQMAYIKSRYPVEYLAAALSVASGKGDKEKKLALIYDLVDECNRNGIAILSPDILYSKAECVPEKGNIRLGFSLIHNVSSAAIKIEEAKLTEQDPLTEVLRKLFGNKINKKVVESLCKAGCFDRYCDRNHALAVITKMCELKSKPSKKRRDEFFNLKDEDVDISLVPFITSEERDTQVYDYTFLCYQDGAVPLPNNYYYSFSDRDSLESFLSTLSTVKKGTSNVRVLLKENNSVFQVFIGMLDKEDLEEKMISFRDKVFSLA